MHPLLRRVNDNYLTNSLNSIVTQNVYITCQSGQSHQSASPNVTEVLPSLPSLPLSHPLKVGGRLQNFWQIWQDKGASLFVVSVLKNGYVLQFTKHPPLARHPVSVPMPSILSKRPSLGEAIELILTKGAMVKVQKPRSLGYYSHLFLVPKKTGSWRPIIDLSHLNAFLVIEKFHMEIPES